MLQRRLQGQRRSRPRRPPTSTAGSCPATRTSSSTPSRELVGEGIEHRLRLSQQQPWETPYDGDLVDADGAAHPRRGPGRHRRAVPDERRHRRQALPQARHARPTASRRCGCPPTSTSPRCSTASTSGCRSTRWSSARGSSTGSSTRSEPDSLASGAGTAWRMILRRRMTRRVPSEPIRTRSSSQPPCSARSTSSLVTTLRENSREKRDLVELPLHARRRGLGATAGCATRLSLRTRRRAPRRSRPAGSVLDGERALELRGGAGADDRAR